MRPVTALLVVSTAALLSLIHSAAAQGRRAPLPAFTDAAAAGPDFSFQGEYGGFVQSAGGSAEYAGLQVIALGEGSFDAVRYRGGLPGSGWDRGIQSRFSGRVANGKLNLAGAKDKIAVADGVAVVQNDAGRELGRLVRLNRRSSTLGMAPPPGATVLFGNGTTDQLQGAKLTDDGFLRAGVLTKMPVGAFRLHLEFRTPFMPTARGQARGNSGVYIQQRYEVQILDSFGLEGAENECGGLYRQTRPDLNMCLPPLAWQTYDIWFTPARFAADGKTKLQNAEISVLHNGYPVHWQRSVIAKTGGGRQEGPERLPINLQDHGNPVAFRNIWIVPATSGGYVQVASSNSCPPGFAVGSVEWVPRTGP
jgi:hypothetical protein